MISQHCMRRLGKRPLDESGKQPVNEDDEEIDARVWAKLFRVPSVESVIVSEAKQSIASRI
ncbi:hypothetical protein [Bradyrhizobium icense]|uniref:hypothetical protein n=1 Tax=Bradyrhizobium icense TaxID=1274631 RepID=UPI0012EA7EC6|nr:hypothetical protein [Bradyrhizobium icense]